MGGMPVTIVPTGGMPVSPISVTGDSDVLVTGSRAQRIRTLRTLRDSILRQPTIPAVMASPPTITSSGSQTLTTGYTLYKPCDYQNLHYYDYLYTFCGGVWSRASTGSPGNNLFLPNMTTQGNGTDPSVVIAANDLGGSVLWETESDTFEIVANIPSGSDNAWRMKVDGEYVAADATSNFKTGTTAGTLRYHKLVFSSVKKRRFEFIGGAGVYFGGIICLPKHAPTAWKGPAIKACMWSDSMAGTIADTTTTRDAALIRPEFGMALREATGLKDFTMNGSGGTGFYADQSGTRSDFLERSPYDWIGKGFNVTWETGGLNDSQNIQSRVEELYAAWIADDPTAIIFSCSPTATSSVATGSNTQLRNEEKRAAAAKFPKNVVFIDTLSLTGTTPVPELRMNHGTGRVGSTTSDGNADLNRGTDGTHPSVAGGQYMGRWLAKATLPAIDTLLAANAG